MRYAFTAVFVFVSAVGCDQSRSGDSATRVKANVSMTPTQNDLAKASSARDPQAPFEGTYRAAWGETIFSQSGSTVTARYPGGALECSASENRLQCTWKEGTASGRAKLQKQPNGTIQGTWGNGADDSGGGPWTFTPKGA